MRANINLFSMFVAALIFLFLIFSPLNAQLFYDPLTVYESATENLFLPGGRACGMGGAQIAAGLDGSALWYNPALLTRIRNVEISASLTHQRFANETIFMDLENPEVRVTNTRLGSIWGISPLPTQRRNVVLGISVNRVRSFDRIFRYVSSIDWYYDPSSTSGWGGGEDENGGLWSWSFGGAVELSARSSLGFSLDIFDGEDDYFFFFDSTYVPDDYLYRYSHIIEDDYSGISGKMGFLYSADRVNVGGVIGLPTSLSLDQSAATIEIDNEGLNRRSRGQASYRYVLPFWFGAGVMVDLKGIVLACDVIYSDYVQMEYKSGFVDLARANLTVKRYYEDAFNYHIGAEYLFPSQDLRLRAGYYHQKIPFTAYPVSDQPEFFTLGLGYIADGKVSIDGAFLTGSWERKDPFVDTKEKYKAQRFIVTLSYRM